MTDPYDMDEALHALLLMYEQYCVPKGHLCMSAGEHALSVLSRHGLAEADDGAGTLKLTKKGEFLSDRDF